MAALLRFYSIATDPPGLYVDEVSIGLNAYDILKTGKDQFGTPHPLFFTAFGEYKMPVYIYFTSASMAFFGKNEFAIRFSSAFLGTLTVLVFFFLSKELFTKSTGEYAGILSLLSAGIIAILPWHIHFSRAGFEATVALFFYCLSILLFLLYQRKKGIWLMFFSGLSLLMAFYTYDGYRLIAPLIGLLGFNVMLNSKKDIKWGFSISIVLCLLALPLFIFSLSNGLIRFQQTSAFSQTHFVNLWQAMLANIIIFIKNYFSYFSISYLLSYGDQINRHQVQGWGLLYLWQLPYIVAGFISLLKSKDKTLKTLILFCLITMPIVPALTQPSPHTLRFLYAVLPYTFLTVWGIYQLVKSRIRYKWIIAGITIVFICLQMVYFIDYYFVHYPRQAIIDWGGGCKAVAQNIAKENAKYQQIIIDEKINCIPDYFSFYIPKIPVIYSSKPFSIRIDNKKTLVISSTKQDKKGNHLYDIHLVNLNKDTFAEFWSL